MAYNLGFISDNDIYHHVAETVKKYKQSLSINLKEFNSNLIDPIKLTFDAKIYNKDIQIIIDQEMSPNLLKSLYLLAFKKYEGFSNLDMPL